MGQAAESVVRAMGIARTKGTRVFADGGERVTRTHHAAPADLDDVVERFSIVRWNLEGREPIEQEMLPSPSVHVVFGDHRPGVHGPATSRSVAPLTRSGGIVGIKFRPAGFRALLRAGLEPSGLVDRPLGVHEAFAASTEARALGDELASTAEDATKLELVTRFLRAHHPGPDDDDREVNAIVDVSRLDCTLTRVARLAEHAGRPVRSLERLFRSRLGVSPKWVIRRFRAQEAAARLAKGMKIDLTALAHLLGYADPSHFIHDFRAQIGRTPAQYIALCEARS